MVLTGRDDRKLAERLLSTVRAQDTVSRLGDDEFTVLLEDVTGKGDARRGPERSIEFKNTRGVPWTSPTDSWTS